MGESGPFDEEQASFAGGYFLGDYEGLTTSGNIFQPFFVQAVSRAAGNPSDVLLRERAAAALSATIGHTDASFTLRTHVHLLDEDQPKGPVRRTGWQRDGNKSSTERRDTARAVIAETSGFAAESLDTGESGRDDVSEL